jgi:hypothetical protein
MRSLLRVVGVPRPLPLLLVREEGSVYHGQDKPGGDDVPEGNVVPLGPRYGFCCYEVDRNIVPPEIRAHCQALRRASQLLIRRAPVAAEPRLAK